MTRNPTTIDRKLSSLVKNDPGAPAIYYQGETVSFAALAERSAKAAQGLRDLGIGPGDRVALWLPNAPAWMYCFFALARLGATAVSVNTRFKSSEVADIVGRSGAKALVYWPSFRGIDFPGILAGALDTLPSLETVIAYEETADFQLPPAGDRTVASMDDILSSPPMMETLSDAESRCIIFTTSGTTRLPKLVQHCHRTVLVHASDVADAFGFSKPSARVMQMIPFCGTYGFTHAIAVLLSGRPLVLHPTFEPDAAARLIREFEINRAAMTDEMIRKTYAVIEEPVPFKGIEFYTGARAHDLVGMSEARGFDVIGVYGSSEVQALFARQRKGEDRQRMTEAGGYPVPKDAKVRARDPETGEIVAPEESGELEIFTPGITVGYFNDPEATAKAFTDDGYFRTGDLGFVRADGSYKFITRMGEVLRLGGFLVNPAEIEAHVEKCPAIRQCQVVGVPSPGERDGVLVVAFYIPNTPGAVGEDVLLRHCKEGMANYKVPDRFVETAAFPVVESANNVKIQRNKLADLAREMFIQPASD